MPGAIGTAREAAAGKEVLVIGAGAARQCLGEQLIDEIVVHIAPVLLGGGARFFAWPEARGMVRLEILDVQRPGRLPPCSFAWRERAGGEGQEP